MDIKTHTESSPLAGKIVRIKKGVKHPQIPDFEGSEYYVEDWWDKLTSYCWMYGENNPACIIYGIRLKMEDNNIPYDNEVLYGKVGLLGHLVHISEIEEIE